MGGKKFRRERIGCEWRFPSPLRHEVVFGDEDEGEEEWEQTGLDGQEETKEKWAKWEDWELWGGDGPSDENFSDDNFFEIDSQPNEKPAPSEEIIHSAETIESHIWPLISGEKQRIQSIVSFTLDVITKTSPKYPPGFLRYSPIANQKIYSDDMIPDAKEKIATLMTQLRVLTTETERSLDTLASLEQSINILQEQDEKDRKMKRIALRDQRLEKVKVNMV